MTMMISYSWAHLNIFLIFISSWWILYSIFYHIHHLPQLLPNLAPFPAHPILCLLSAFKLLKSNLCSPYIFGYVAFPVKCGLLTRGHTFEKSWLFFLSWHLQLSVVQCQKLGPRTESYEISECLRENSRRAKQESCDLSFSQTRNCCWNVFYAPPRYNG